MVIEYYLRENALTSDPDDYNAVVVSKGSASEDELVNMIQAQRTYEVNARAIRTSDEIMQATNNIAG